MGFVVSDFAFSLISSKFICFFICQISERIVSGLHQSLFDIHFFTFNYLRESCPFTVDTLDIIQAVMDTPIGTYLNTKICVFKLSNLY